MKKLLIFAALAEGGFGLLLFAFPPLVSRLLFGAEVSGAGVIVGRLTGMCLIALGVACWPFGDSYAAFYGMLTWSALALLYLIVAGVGGAVGILLWPAVAVHAI